ncbi:hypothetical protein Tco_0273671 [Tanacetum coccineum]
MGRGLTGKDGCRQVVIDSDRTESDIIKTPVLNQSSTEYYKEEEEKINDEETMDDEEEDKVTKELNQQNISQESGFEQVEEDAHVTLTLVLDIQKADEPVQKSYVSFDFTIKLLNLDNPSSTNNEIASLMESSTHHATTVPVITSVFTKTIPPPPLFFNPLPQQASPTPTTSKATTSFPSLSDFTYSTYEAATALSKFELIKILIDKIEKNKSYDKADHKRELYKALVTSYQTDKDIFDTYGEVFSLKRDLDEKYKDQDPSAGSDRGTKRRKLSKDAKSSRVSRSKEKKSSSTSKDTSQSQHKSSSKYAHLKEPSYTVEDPGVQQDQEFITRENDEQPADKEVTKADWFKKPNLTELEHHLEECSKATTERLDWYNPEGKPYTFVLRKPLPLIQDHQGYQDIPWDFFINNVLEYLKGRDLSKGYSTSVMKTKAVVYEIKWIEDLVFTRLSIMKMYDYGHLEEIQVRREDQELHTFREGDFPRLRLQDIKDMLLLLVQQKLSNLTIDERYDLNVALRMFTRRIVIQRSDLRNRIAYTSYSDPHGIIYVDQFDRKRLIRADELYKSSDGTLDDVRTALHDISKGIRM